MHEVRRNRHAIHQHQGFEWGSSKEKKEEMISRVTQLVAEIEARPHPKENLIPHTWCLIEEVDLEGWGDGGKPVTREMLKAALTGKG